MTVKSTVALNISCKDFSQGEIIIWKCKYCCHLTIIWFCIIQIYSGITSGRVFDRELLYTEILEV